MSIVESHVASESGTDVATQPVLEIENLEHRLRDRARHDEFVVTVKDRLSIRPGSYVAILGPSGCGKTTLLTVLGLLRRPFDPASVGRFRMTVDDDGTATEYDVKELWRRNKQRRIENLRRRHIGFALQSGELLTSLNVRENIAAPLNLNGIFGRQCRDRVDELLKAFGLEAVDGRAEKELVAGGRSADLPQRGFDSISMLARARVNKLSGGEYQRVVLARAVAHRPAIVFVDEPTSALNRELARTALRLLREARSERGGREATVMITHDELLATEFADLIVRMAPLKGRTAGEVVEIVENCP